MEHEISLVRVPKREYEAIFTKRNTKLPENVFPNVNSFYS